MSFFPSVIPPHGHYHNTISDTKQNVNESMMSRLEQLRAQFGDSNVNGALVNSLMSGFGATLKDFIRNSAMPGFMKEAAINEVNRFLAENRQPTTADAQAGVHECGAGELASNAGSAIAEGANAEAENTTKPDAVAKSDSSSSADDPLDNISYGMAQEESDRNKEGGSAGGKDGNWLVALAGGLAKAQIEFLDKAMDAQKTMETNAGAGSDDKEARDDFILAQSKYQASIQMFNIMANLTSTSLKSLGEGLTSIARKQ